MKIVKRLLTIFIVLFVVTPSSFSQEQIVYLDLDYVVVNTKAGKSILNELENSKNIALSKFEKKGLIFSGMSPDNKLPEIIELKNHPWFIGVQFHPEFKSRPLSPHPLFKSFIKASKNYHGK